MTASPSPTMPRAAAVFARRAAASLAALAMIAGCASSDGGTSHQASGTVIGALVGGTVGGLAFGTAGGVVGGALVGALAGNLVGRALDAQEQRRLAEAAQVAFTSETNVPTAYTVEATNAPAGSAPTIVAAMPVGPAAGRSDGSTCRPIELTATKDGQTTTETSTFCRAAGSSELRPVAI